MTTIKKTTTKKTTEKPVANNTNEPVLHCPRCGTGMRKLKKNDAILDICSRCGGMWLDRDEVTKLAARHPNAR